MSLVVEIQINSSSPAQQQQLVRQIRDVVSGTGFHVDQSTYTPSASALAELAAVPSGRASIRVYQN